MTEDIRTEALTASPVVTLADDDGARVVRIAWRFPTAPVGVWPWLVTPDLLARWSPVVPDHPLTSPGPATSREDPDAEPVDATVTEVDDPRMLAHRWGDDTLRWAVEPHTDGSLLTLADTLGDPDSAAANAAGWHVCLTVLSALVEGRETPRVVGRAALTQGWPELADRYATLLRVPPVGR